MRNDVPAIKTKRLSKVFGTRKAVDNVSIELPAGAFLSVFGPNGAGKTTLLRILSTLTRPSSGFAELGGSTLRSIPKRRARTSGSSRMRPCSIPT